MIIDVQYAIDHPSWGPRNNPDAETRIRTLLDAWRERAMPLLHVRHMSTDPTSTYRPGQYGNDFKPICAPLLHERVLKKQVHSAFIHTGLEQLLRAEGIGTLVVVGVATNNSVESTVRMAGNLGFETLVVDDATFTFAKTDYAGVAHSAETMHAIALANLQDEFATVVTSAEVLSRLSN